MQPEAFRGAGGRLIRQHRHARPARIHGWQAPAWLVPAVFLCVLLVLVVIIALTA